MTDVAWATLVPWLLGLLSLIPAILLPLHLQWISYPILVVLVTFGYWLVWPRWP